jgi:hypothetical protein
VGIEAKETKGRHKQSETEYELLRTRPRISFELGNVFVITTTTHIEKGFAVFVFVQ